MNFNPYISTTRLPSNLFKVSTLPSTVSPTPQLLGADMVSLGANGSAHPTLQGLTLSYRTRSQSPGQLSETARNTLGFDLLESLNIEGRPTALANGYQLQGDEILRSDLPRALETMIHGGTFYPNESGVDIVGPYLRGSIAEDENGTIKVETNSAPRTGQSTLTPEGDGYREEYLLQEFHGGHPDKQTRREWGVRNPDGTGETNVALWSPAGHPMGSSREVVESDGDGGYEITGQTVSPDGYLTSKTTEYREGLDSESDFVKETEYYDGGLIGTSRSTRVTDESGAIQETEQVDTPTRTVEGYRLIDADGRVSGQRIEVTPILEPDLDIDGTAWFGDNSPERMFRLMGDAEDISATKVVQDIYSNDGTVRTESTVYRNADGTREMERIQTQGANPAWMYREVGEDGLVDSQLFFQGTKDTVVTDRRRDGNMEVTTTTAETPSVAEGTPGAPSEEKTVVRKGEGVTSEEVDSVFEQPQFKGLNETQAYQEFLAGVDGRGVGMAMIDSEKVVDGERQEFRSFTMVDSQGRKLVGVYDEEQRTYALQLESADGEVLKAGSATQRDGSTEVDNYQPSDLLEPWQETAENPGTPPTVSQGVGLATGGVQNALQGDGKIPRATAYLFRTAPKNVNQAGELIGQFGNAAVAAFATLDAAEALMQGRGQDAAQSAGSVMTGTAEMMKPINGVSGYSPLYRQTFRFLGGAGLALQSGELLEDLGQGRYGRAVAGAVSLTGTATALFSSLRFAGPIGWGLSFAGTAGVWAWDYNNENRIAPLAEQFR